MTRGFDYDVVIIEHGWEHAGAGDIQRVGVDVRTAADACAGQDEHIVEVLNPLETVELGRGKPQKVGQVPLRFRNVFILPTRRQETMRHRRQRSNLHS
jgi:hypothetical protein